MGSNDHARHDLVRLKPDSTYVTRGTA